MSKQSKFMRSVTDYLVSKGAIETDGSYRYSLPTSIGELQLHVDDKYTTIFTRFDRIKAGLLFTRNHHVGECNPYSAKWNFHLAGTSIASFIFCVDQLLAFKPTAEFWQEVQQLEGSCLTVTRKLLPGEIK